MSNDLYKAIIDKFLSGLKINPTDADETINKPDNEMSVVKEELTGAISGDKMYGDMPGLEIEENAYDFFDEEISPEITADSAPDPLSGIEVVFFYLANKDLVSEIVSYPHSMDNTGKNTKFGSIEDSAKYILKKQNVKFTEEDINRQSRELIMLNSDGNETTLDDKVSNALKNINNGNINYVTYNKSKEQILSQSNDSQEFYKNIGLSGNMCGLAQGIYLKDTLSTDIEQDSIENIFTDTNKLDKESVTALETFSEMLNILAMLPLTANKPVQAGVKAINKLLLTKKEISGAELIETLYNSQGSVIKSGIGQFNNLQMANTNVSAPKSNTLSFMENAVSKNSNISKYLNNALLENLRLLLSFESAKTIIVHQTAEKFEHYGSKSEIVNIIENFDSLNNISFQFVENDEDEPEYIVKFLGKTASVKTAGKAIAVALNLMSNEVNFKNMYLQSQILSDDLINANTPKNNVIDETNRLADISDFSKDVIKSEGIPHEIDIDKIKAQLFQGITKFNGECIGKFLDSGIFICKINNKYFFEIPAENTLDKKYQLIYTSSGKLKQEKTEYINSDGTYTTSLLEYTDGNVKREFITAIAGNKVVLASEKTADGYSSTCEYFYKDGILSKTVEITDKQDKLTKYPQAITVKKISSFPDSIDIYEYSYPKYNEYAKTIVINDKKCRQEKVININHNGIATDNKGYSVNIKEILKMISTNEDYDSIAEINNQNIPDGYYYNEKDNMLTEINQSKIKTTIQGDENFGAIKLYDENKYLLGELRYKLSSDGNDICIYHINTPQNNTLIKSLLLNGVLNFAEKYNKSVITTFLSELNSSDNKVAFNLEYYYKMGFQAEDFGVDKLIRKCLTKGICIPSNLTQFVKLRHTGDITPSRQVAVNSLQDMRKNLEAFFNHDNYLINVEYKNLFENINKLDCENINQHLVNIKKCLESDFDGNSIKIAIENGYFSSSIGAQAFETFYNIFTNQGTNHSSDGLNVILTHFDVKNFENAKKRKLIDKLNVNNVKSINALAECTDKQYKQRMKYADMGIEYISENDDINRLAVKYVKDKTGNSYNQEEIEKILLQVKNPQKIAELVDKLIKADSFVVISLLKYTKNPKFVAANLNRLLSLDKKLYNASDNSQIQNDFTSERYNYDGICTKIYPNEEIMSIMFEIDSTGKYNKEQLYEIAARINNNNKYFVKKLALSDSVAPDEVLRILKDTGFITILCEHPSELSVSQKMEAYNLLLSMPKHLKSICKDSGLDIDSEIKNFSEQFESKYNCMNISKNGKKAFDRIISDYNNKKEYKAFAKFDFSQYGKNGLPLKYTKEEFTQNIEQILSEIPESEQILIMKHFGLSKGITGGLDGIPNNKSFETDNTKLKKISLQVQKEIENYTLKNEIMVQDKDVKKVLNDIIQGIPEFMMFVGKKQHGEHAYSVDIHTLKVLQSAMNDPLYSELPDSDKTVLRLAIVMHDFGKKGGIVDTGHAGLSTEYADTILNRFDLPENIKNKVLELVKNHHWFADFNTGKSNANDIAEMFRSDDDFNLFMIFAKADFSNVNPIFQFYKTGTKTPAEFEKYMAERYNRIKKIIET